ncbi:hypothetical protein C8R45DRAFT_1074681 [Mycena sanguinolenta]|nr:hypothetical protein C8R45DRAFT_1074681 [Mycena sanguinolenta]
MSDSNQIQHLQLVWADMGVLSPSWSIYAFLLYRRLLSGYIPARREFQNSAINLRNHASPVAAHASQIAIRPAAAPGAHTAPHSPHMETEEEPPAAPLPCSSTKSSPSETVSPTPPILTFPTSNIRKRAWSP